MRTPALPLRTIALPALAAIALACAGCGSQQAASRSSGTGGAGSDSAIGAQSTSAAGARAHPQAIEPAAGQASQQVAGAGSAQAQAGAQAQVSVGSAGAQLPQPMSNSQVRQQLAQSGLSANPNQATLAPDGLAVPPLDAPAAVQAVIQAGNQIAHLPYRWGGGHATYEDTAYDCSGSISFVFGAAHLLSGSIVSGGLMSWGDPGPGRWITVFANGGHTFMYIAGLRFDTVALAETGDRWSTRSASEDVSSFAIRHPPGL
jgi:cell wall-associated NlpC family hydrolase